MRGNFDRCLSFSLDEEGGFVNHPSDPGGATNHGITQAVYDTARTRWGLAPRSVRDIEMGEVQSIYQDRYWLAIGGDSLPPGVDLATFDAAVNSGPGQAAKWLQRAVNAEAQARGRAQIAADGAIGPKTVAAASKCDPRALIVSVCSQRLAMLQRLPTWPIFGRGWAGRVARVEAAAAGMMGGGGA